MTMRRREFLAGAAAATLLPAMSSVSHAAGEGLTDLTATAAVRAMRQGDITAEAYAGALLARAKALTSLNAFITLEPDAVLEAARAADKRRQAGNAAGLLHGLPIPVKDSMNTRLAPTSNGTPALRGFRPTSDAALVKRLFDQGALLMGKTNMTEISFGWTSSNEAFGFVHNPYDRDRVPGGSSGGSAAAVASHIAPLATAADTLGSIRVPAAMCGIAGLRPTYGRYPGAGIMPLTTDKFDQGGALTRAVEDLALFDAVETGETEPLVARPLKGVRIGVAPFYMAQLDPEIDSATQEALHRLRDAGAEIVEADVPDVMKDGFNIAAAIMLYESQPTIAAFLEQQKAGIDFDQMFAQVSPNIKAFFKQFAMPPGRPPKEGYDAMLKKRDEFKSALRSHFAAQRIDALALPATAAFPPKIGADDVEIGTRKVSLFDAFGRNTALGPVGGTPGLILPSGISKAGLPIAMEFEALPGDDRKLLALGLSFEKALGPIPAPKV
jgi:indoleacetamide hydrolase